MPGTKTILLRLLTAVAILGSRPAETAAQSPAFLVRDVNTTTLGSGPAPIAANESSLFFGAWTPATGWELFKSEGTESGTSIVVETRPGRESSFSGKVAVFDGSEFFTTSGSDEPGRLWRTDGTDAGTVVLNERAGGVVWSLTVADEILFFTTGSTCADELWTSDGSEAGTLLVRRFTPTATQSSICVSLPTAVGHTLFFVVQDGSESRSLWKSDGSAKGTVPLGNFGVGSTPYGLDGLTNVDGELFFVAGELDDRPQLWKSDGTADGTVLVKEAWLRSQPAPSELTAVDGVLFFIANDGRYGTELWKSDGTPDGTVLVRDIRPGATGSNPHDLRDLDGRLVFSANDGVHGDEPWKSDGTQARTRLLLDTSVSDDFSPRQFTATSVGLFFAVRRRSRDELWHTDGTTAGTRRLTEFPTSLRGENYLPTIALENLFGANGALFFTVDDPSTGRELWTSDGTSEGTRLVADLNLATNGSMPDNLVAAGDTAYFTAYVAPGHQTLWKTDGSAEGTVMIKDGGQQADPSVTRPPPPPPFDYLTVVNGIVFFTARDSLHGRELWRTDGTEAGTGLVRDIVPGPDSSSPGRPGRLIGVGDLLVFVVSGDEVWASDGTEAGTSRIWSPDDESERGPSSYVDRLEATGGRAFFVTAGGDLPPALWTTDGTAEGTELITRVGTSEQVSYYGFTAVGDGVFFAGATPEVGSLWRTDGTAAGTAIVREFPASNARAAWPSPSGLCEAGGLLMFVAVDERGSELWRSDGTAAGTVLVKDINPFWPPRGPLPGRAGLLPRWLTCVGDLVFFTADDGVTGEELWKSDGTEAGTHLVRDLSPDPQGSGPIALMQVDGHLVFRACDSAGCEVWASDGTEGGTHIVADVAPGAASSDPGPLVAAGSQLFFAATEDLHGRELWALPSAAVRSRSYDCDGDGSVTIRDLITMVNGALSNATPTGCPSGDRNLDGRITIDELVEAVNEALTT